MNPSPHTRKWLIRLGLPFLGVGIALGIAETALRLAGVGYPLFSRPDDERGWSLRAGAQGWFTSEGHAWVLINRDGLRDREHGFAKPPGTLRLAVLGDSFTEALEVPQDSTFWSVLERELSRRTLTRFRRVEVINFGVRGYGTAQALLSLRCCVWQYQPDIVLLAFYHSNDVSDNSPELDRTSTRYARPYFIEGPDRWKLDRSFQGGWRYRLSKLASPFIAHSRIFQLIIQARHVRIRSSQRSPIAEEVPADLTLGWPVYREPTDSAWLRAWRTTEWLLREMATDAREHGAWFGVVMVPAAIQIHPDSAIRARYLDTFGIGDFRYPSRRIQSLASREGLQVLDLAPAMRAYADQNGAYLYGFSNRRLGLGHWNPLGHRLAGEQIGSWLLETFRP